MPTMSLHPSLPLFSNVFAFTEYAIRPVSLRFFLMRPATVASSSLSLIILRGGSSPFFYSELDAVAFSSIIIVTENFITFTLRETCFAC